MPKVAELPWQWCEAQAWPALTELLKTVAFMNAAWDRSHFELEMYWAAIAHHTGVGPHEAYQHLIEAPEHMAGAGWQILRLLRDFVPKKGHANATLALCDYLLRQENGRGNTDLLRRLLAEKSVLLWCRRDHRAALEVSRELERLARECDDHHRLQIALDGQASVLEYFGDLVGALRLAGAAEDVCREHENLLGLQAVLGNHATLLMNHQRLQEALPLLVEAETISRRINHVEGICAALVKRALLVAGLEPNTFDPIMQMLDEAEALSRQYGKIGYLVDALSLHCELLGIEAGRLVDAGDHTSALRLLRQQERVCREWKDHRRDAAEKYLLCIANLVACMVNCAATSVRAGRGPAEALALVDEACGLAMQTGLRDETAQVAHVALVLRRQIAYRQELTTWEALPFWERLFTRKPSEPEEQFGPPPTRGG